MNRKLIAAVACRNDGSRLYGKPLQNLDIENKITVLDHIIAWMQEVPEIEDIVLGIAEGNSNLSFIDYARKKNLKFIVGDEIDVLGRLIQCANLCDASDVFRITSESPYTCLESINEAWQFHIEEDADLTKLDKVPDGSGFEIIKTAALEYSHLNGEDKHRSELCTLYIRENKDKFKLADVKVPDNLIRDDLRLTIDYPEDLVICRAIYTRFKEDAPKIPLQSIIEFLDRNPELKSLVAPFVDEGLKTMYL